MLIKICLLFLVASFNSVSADNLVSTEGTPPAEATVQSMLKSKGQVTCEAITRLPTCVQFRQAYPELQSSFLKCENQDFGVEFSRAALACARGGVSAATNLVESVSGLFTSKMSDSGAAFVKFQESCFADLDCRKDAYAKGLKAYYKREPTQPELSRLEKVPTTQRQQIQPFYYGILVTLKELKAKEAEMLARGFSLDSDLVTESLNSIAPYWTPSLREIYAPPSISEQISSSLASAKSALQKLGIEIQCLDGAALAENLCFGAASVVDPVAAWALAAKLPRAWAFLSKLKSVDGRIRSARAVRAEAVLGRKISLLEEQKIEQAHRVGEGQLGKDGTPAGVDNYTLTQLREKRKVLSDFSEDDVRKLMEAGIVGSDLPKPGGLVSQGLTDAQFKRLEIFEAEGEATFSKVMAELNAKTELSAAEKAEVIKQWSQEQELLKAKIDELLSAPAQSFEGQLKQARDAYKQSAERARKFSPAKTKVVEQPVSVGQLDIAQLKPNESYPIQKDNIRTIQNVTFSEKVVKYLREEDATEAKLFLKAIEKGFVGEGGSAGLRRMRAVNIVEVKVVGNGRIDRLLGCLESGGTLSILEVATKKGGGVRGVDAGAYRGLCKD